MPRTRIRSLARSLAASEPALETADPPEPEQLDRGGEAAALSGDPVEVEEIERRSAASDPSRRRPAPVEGEQALEGPTWRNEFDSVEELYQRFKDVDHLRGRLANELGLLRRRVGLHERTLDLIARSRDPLELMAFVQAARLIHEPQAHASIEQMLEAGEQVHQEVSHAT